jgi:predicted dehydrogenase
VTFHAAIIGCGRIASGFADEAGLADDVYTHAEAYVRSTATELVAVCDADAQIASACAGRWNVDAAFANPAELLSTVQPEIVSICTPDRTHYELARMALETPSVRGLLCEKPLATTVAEAQELANLASGYDKKIAVAYVRRYADNFRALKRFLADGSIGPVRALSGWYGKGVLHNGSHWFDLTRMLAGDVAWVEATDRLLESGDDPSLDVTLGLASGAVASLRATNSSHYSIFEMDLLTDSGRVAIRDSGHRIELFRASPSERYAGYSELTSNSHEFGNMRNTMLHAVDDLAAAIPEKRPALCTAQDGIAALRIASAASKSAAEGCRIEISA